MTLAPQQHAGVVVPLWRRMPPAIVIAPAGRGLWRWSLCYVNGQPATKPSAAHEWEVALAAATERAKRSGVGILVWKGRGEGYQWLRPAARA